MDDSGDLASEGMRLTIWVTWFALVAALFIYLGVAFYLSSAGEVGDQQDPERLRTLLYAFGGLALAQLAVIRVVRKRFFFGSYEAGEFETLQELRGHYFTMSIMTWGLAEAIAIFGFALSVISYELFYYPIFAVPGLGLLLVYRPQLAGLVDAYREAHPEVDGDEEDDQQDAPTDDETDEVW